MRDKATQPLQLLVKAISLPGDGTVDVQKKLVLLVGNLGGFFFSTILTLLYIYHDLAKPAMLSGIYLGAVVLSYIYYFQTKRLNITALLFSILLFAELVAVHITLGGFRASGVGSSPLFPVKWVA